MVAQKTFNLLVAGSSPAEGIQKNIPMINFKKNKYHNSYHMYTRGGSISSTSWIGLGVKILFRKIGELLKRFD